MEDMFKSWAAPPGQTEKTKMNNAETAIKKAITSHDRLSSMDISIFSQGSYSSSTSIRRDSDVDVCIRLNSTFFPRYPEGKTKEDYGNVDGSIRFDEYKNLIHEALNSSFGIQYVTRGNKAFNIHSNSYRVDADAVPTFAYRYYNGSNKNDFINPIGVAFNTDKEDRIINWPEQVYLNGIKKQKETNERYKKMVRIFKKLRNEMQEKNISGSYDVASFLIESMIWNVPSEKFGNENYIDDVKNVAGFCYLSTINNDVCKNHREVNGIKYLFNSKQPWNREKANDFFVASWEYLGF